MDLRPPAVQRLLRALGRLPGIGPRSAQRLVEHLLTSDPGDPTELAAALIALGEEVCLCERCYLLADEALCPVCRDPARDASTILVISEPTTAWTVEATGQFHGVYHALLGKLSPLHGIGPDDLKIADLVERARADIVTEVILATDPTVEGETTALYVARRLQPLGVTVSRPAAGIPVGGELAAVDRLTLAQALSSRRPL